MGINHDRTAERIVSIHATNWGSEFLKAKALVIVTEELVRDILADEAAKVSAPAASEPEPDKPPQRAEGVPEWCIDAAREVANVADETLRGSGGSNRDLGRIVRRHAEAEIARRTAELTAERDQARAEVEKFKTTDVGTLVADAIRADRESDERECRREIRRLRAEVERLKARQIPDGWEMSGTLGDSRRRIAELEAEVERLSRPVDLGSVHKARVDGIDYVYDYDARQAVRNERNAREAAEAALAELRELIRTHYLMWSGTVAGTEWSFLKRIKSCPDADLNAALAEFRKTKEPTQ